MADAARNVLIISRSYYPHCSPGSHRIAGFGKFFPEFGWTPTILSPDWTPENCFDRCDLSLVGRDPCEVVRVPYKLCRPFTPMGLIQRAIKRLYFWTLPDQALPALLAGMTERAVQLLAERPFDVIVASHPATMALTVGSRASQASGVPWVADLRDLVGGKLPGEARPLRTRWHLHRHTAVRRSAAAFTTVSEPLAEQLRAAYPDKTVTVVFNGYDGDLYAEPGEPARDTFTVAYCGEITSTETPAPLLDALDAILASEPEKLERFRLRFYGTTRRKVARHLGGRPCARLVEIVARIPFEQSVRIQKEANALLVLSCPGTKGILTTKLFEYFGARRPVLAVPSDGGAMDALIAETGAGRVGSTPDEIAGILLGWLAEWEKEGGPAWRGRPEAVEQYTRRSQTARMARALDEVVGARP